MRWVPSLTQYQGFSLCSRTYFLKTTLKKNSIDSNPASSICGNAGSMEPIFMFKAHRLWLPSRTVVSINLTSLVIISPELVQKVQIVQAVQTVNALIVSIAPRDLL